MTWKSTLLILFFVSAVSSPIAAKANLAFCAALLTEAEYESPETIRATLAHALITDYRILFNPPSDIAMLYKVGPEYYGTNIFAGFNSILPAVRLGGETKRAEVDAAVAKMWSNLLKFYSNSPEGIFESTSWGPYKFAMESRRGSDAERIAQLASILSTIEASPKLKGPMIALLENYYLKIDDWSHLLEQAKDGTSNPPFSYRDETEIKRKFLEEFGKGAVPTVLREGALSSEAMREFDVNKLNRAFDAAPNSGALSNADGIIFFDAGARAGVYSLSKASVTVRDEFTQLPGWNFFFDDGAKWVASGEKAPPAEKITYLERLVRARNVLDLHTRETLKLRHSTNHAEKHILLLIRELENAAPATTHEPLDALIAESMIAERANAKRRLESVLSEVRALRATMTAWHERLIEAESLLAELNNQASASSPNVRSPATLVDLMKKLREKLDLDPILVERLKVKRSWLG